MRSLEPMSSEPVLPPALAGGGIILESRFIPGDLGELIRLHGLENRQDYGFDAVHEAYCARIAADYLLSEHPGRSRVWLLKRQGTIVGSVFIFENSPEEAQLRLLFVARVCRDLGLGRWLVAAAVEYSRQAGFTTLCLWTVKELKRAVALYEAFGFVPIQEKFSESWGVHAWEVRYELRLAGETSKTAKIS